MSKDDFNQLLRLVAPFLPQRDPQRIEYRDEELLLATLRYLGTGCSIDLAADSLNIKRSNLAANLQSVLAAIVSAIKSTAPGDKGVPDCSVSFPTDQEDIDAELDRWSSGSDPNDTRYNPFRGCIGAGDGTLIPVYLKNDDSFSVDNFRSRKGM